MGLFDWLRKRLSKEEQAALPSEPRARRSKKRVSDLSRSQWAYKKMRRRLEREGRRNARM